MDHEGQFHAAGDDERLDLPPGFRFHPTDEELISHYLAMKVADQRFSSSAVAEVDFNKCEPWELPHRAKMGEKEWFFFSVKDRKYPTGLRTNRATDSGYWKATGKDKEIHGERNLVGMKKTLVFYTGRAPKGEKTSWIMHEYRLDGKLSYRTFPNSFSEIGWVICRVFQKGSSCFQATASSSMTRNLDRGKTAEEVAGSEREGSEAEMGLSSDMNAEISSVLSREWFHGHTALPVDLAFDENGDINCVWN